MIDNKSDPPWLKPIRLQGKHIRLEPLSHTHRTGLLEASRDGDLSRIWYTSVPSPLTMQSYVSTAVAGREAGTMLPFAVIEEKQGTVVGCTRYCNVDSVNKRLEIGYTWYAASVQRTAVNTEAKFLLLQHAFESLGSIAVEFRTNWFNHRSREAILRLGAKQDGVLRNHQRMPEGGFRDTVVYSIIQSEWPMVKQHLQFKLQARPF